MTLTELLLGSPTMVVLMICSVITVSFAVERAFYFMRTKADTASFMRELSSKMQGGDLKAAYAWVSKQKHSAGRVCAQCLGQTGAKESDLKQRFNTAIELEQVEMERNLSVLGTMSNIAPLLGLFGTVIGIIRAFAALDQENLDATGTVIAEVGEALVATAIGLLVALPAVVFYNYYQRVIRGRLVWADAMGRDVLGFAGAEDVSPGPVEESDKAKAKEKG
ncbi:MAG: MotA/TolQ/ExbB proton channel family protein [Myxococcales bacterium]|nr:MotA/TolQ/ExbB proton channel family protein [Myxococcales bacterium]